MWRRRTKMSTEIARIEDALRLSDTITKAINSIIEELIDMNLSTISKELSRKFEELRVLTQVLLDKRREMLSNLRDQKAKRDELNQKVKEVAQIIRQLRERRNELQKFITEKRKEAQEIKDEISKIQENMSLLEKELKGYDHRRTKKLEGEIKRLEWVLQTQTLPDPIEKRLTERIMRLSNTLKELKTKEEKWRKQIQLQRELEQYRTRLGAIKKSLAIYFEERKKIDEKLSELIKIREEKKKEADKFHAEVQRIKEEIDKLNQSLASIREVRNKVIQTLRKIGKIREEKEGLRRKEELKKIIHFRLQEIREKLKNQGRIDYEDLEFLIDYGLLDDEFLNELLGLKSEEEKTELLLEHLETKEEENLTESNKGKNN